ELEALKAVEVAMTDVKTKADLMSSAEANLADAKKTAIGTSGTNPAPPMTAAQRVAMREIEEDKAIAEAAKSKAKKVELTANVAKGKVHEMNFERELKAYHDAEEAWIEAVEGYKTALAKVKDAELNDEELEAALASAEVHQATWRAHARWVKARQADQIIVSSGASLDQLTVAEIAWANVVEGYNMAIEKAMQTKLKCVELTDSLNNALSAQESAQAEAIAFLQTKEIQAREQATTAKIASRTALDNNHCVESDDWNRVVVQAEQAAKNWQKVRETLAQGKLERAAFWRKAAEQSEISAEEWRQYIIQIRTFGNKYTEEEENTFVCQRKAAFITCCLSNDTTSKARFEEATNEGNQFLADLWSKSAEQNQQFAKYLRKGRDCYTGEPLEGAALALEKTTIAIENKNEPLAMLWSKVVTRYQESIEHFCNEAEAELKGNDENATSWNNVGCSIVESAWMLGLASEAVEKEVIAKADKNKLLAELWSKSAAQYQEVAEHYRKVAEAKLNKNNVEVDFLGKVIFSAKDSAFRLKSAAEALEKAVEATAKGNQPLAELWNKTAAQYQKTAEHYQKMVEAKLNRNDVETDHWEKLAVFAEDSASQLNSASKALEEATTAKMKGNQLLAELWSKTAMQYQEIVELVRKAAEVKSNENDEEEDRWGKIADFAKDSVYQLESASRALEEATTAKMKGNQLIAELWSKTAVQCQETAEYKRKAAEAKLNGNDEGADYWEEVASFAVSAALRLNSAAEAVGKAAAVTTKGNQALAELWSKTAVQNQEIAEYDQKAAGARLSGNNSEVVRWRELASSANQAFGLELAAEALEKATETTAEGNQALTELWSKSAVQNQESVEFFRKAAEARLIENDSEVDRWQKMAHSAYQSAVALDKKAKKLAKKKCEK
ncbi:MAG TPA: hypothetical protein VJK54_05090, partial [Chthoniobacterales bacterium]|nr:hypothetical protein [Chthoniobacterales bacterium]